MKNSPELTAIPPLLDLDFDEHLLQIHLPDPDLLARAEVWPSSDYETPEDSASHSLDNLVDREPQDDGSEDSYCDNGIDFDVDALLEVEMDDTHMGVTGMHFISWSN